MQKEALARIKINKLLEKSSWRFFDSQEGRANIVLEGNVKLAKEKIDEYGNNFEKVKNGFVDFLLLDEDGFPAAVLEAKAEDKSPLDGKEQSRRYAQSQNARFIIPDFSVVLFRPNFMLASEEHSMKVHKNQ